MQLIVVDPLRPDHTVIDRAAAILRRGGLVAFPTETVYGLGANALDPDAVDRIYRAKGRPIYNPLIVHLAHAEQVLDVASDWPDRAVRLAAAFWPGPLTLVLPKRSTVPDSVTAGLQTVAVRVPRHPVAQSLLVAAGLPVAAPSANRSMQVSPTTGAHVVKSLGDAVDMILDAGPTAVGIESTVLDLSGNRPTLLRPGTITVSQMERVVGAIVVARHSTGAAGADATTSESARPSPGMLDKHYSPRARLLLVDIGDVVPIVDHEREQMQNVGAIVMHAAIAPSPTVLRLPPDALGYAVRMFGALHSLDDAGCDVIVVERVPAAPEWLGVRDRLERAAT